MPKEAPKEPFKRLSPQEAKRLIDKGNVQIIDVRNATELVVGYIEGSKLIPVDTVFERINEVAEDKDVVFYCAVGVRSALACEMAAAMGRTRVNNVEGGIQAWKAAGLPVKMR